MRGSPARTRLRSALEWNSEEGAALGMDPSMAGRHPATKLEVVVGRVRCGREQWAGLEPTTQLWLGGDEQLGEEHVGSARSVQSTTRTGTGTKNADA